LQGRHPRANRRTLIDPIPTVWSQVTAACPVFPKGVQTYRPSEQPDNSGWRPILIIPQAAIAAAQAQARGSTLLRVGDIVTTDGSRDQASEVVDSHRSPSELLLREGIDWLTHDQARNNLPVGLLYRALGDAAFRDELYLVICRRNNQIVAMGWRSNFPKFGLAATADLSAVAAMTSRVRDDMPDLPCVLGSKALVARFVQAWRRPGDREPERGMPQLVYGLDRVKPHCPVPGALRPAKESDVRLLADWFLRFAEDAHVVETSTEMDVAERVRARVIADGYFLWEDGEPSCMVGAGGPPNQVARVGPVYTPPGKRRRGYAGAATAAASQIMLDRGHPICCLYTDASNPTSNHIYQEIGYELVDEVEEYWFQSADRP
jgi:GNAT superfamily N-acetyltransferase